MSEQHEDTVGGHPGGLDSIPAGATASANPATPRRRSLAEELHRLIEEENQESARVAAPPQAPTPRTPRQWPWVKRSADYNDNHPPSSCAGIPLCSPYAEDSAPAAPASPPEPLQVHQAMSIGLFEMMSTAHRIRNLRAALGWTQRVIAERLGISMRSVIRYEKGQHRTQWLRLPLVLRLRHLESQHAEELIAYLDRPQHA